MLQVEAGEALIAAWGRFYRPPPIDICADDAQVYDPYADLGRAVFPDIGAMFGDEEYLFPGDVLAARH